mgnify:FL=1|jgi:hypothetical protein|tara:strand:- start:6 stop:218 length:213 start_codon:yes stop_codon:yes gene_type:complete
MKVKGTARILLQEITREWEFEHNGEEHTFREYEGVEGRRMWLDDEEVDDQEEEILDDMSAYDIYEHCSEY